MAKFRLHKSSLIGGELSPTALGRTDLQGYSHSCKLLQNMIPYPSGGAYRRPGTIFVDSVDGTTDFAPAIIPFQVSKAESYAVLIGSTFSTPYLRIYRVNSNGSNAPSPGAITGSPPWLGRIAADAAQWGYYDEFHEVQTIQSADVMWMVHPRYKPHKLTRTSQDNFTIRAFDFGLSGATLRDAYPWLAQNSTAITLAPSALTGNITITASASFFVVGMVGAYIKINHAGTIGAARITGYNSPTSVNATVIVNFGATTAVLTWWEAAWSEYRGWPRAVSFYQQRLVYGGNTFLPDTLWFSQLKSFDVFGVSTDTDPTSPVATTSPFTFEIAISEQLNQIQWLSSEKTITIGTSGDEWVMEPVDATLGTYGGNMSVTRQSSYGSSYVQSARKADELIFCDRSGTELRGLIYSQDQQSFVAEPLQAFYDEFPYGEPYGTVNGDRKIRKFAWDGSRKTLWCVDTAGNLRGVTRDRQLGMNAWHSHRMGGFDATKVGTAGGIDVGGGSFTDDPAYVVCAGSVISLAVVPNPLIGTNDIWLVVKRKINSAFTYHIERFIGKDYNYSTAYSLGGPVGSYLVDAAVLISNIAAFPSIAADTFTGLTHLKGEAVTGTAINNQGIFKITADAVDNSGHSLMHQTSGWHLLTENTAIYMGLAYDSVVEPVRPDAGSQIGSAQAGIKRLHTVTPRFYRTNAAKIGRDPSTLETLIFRESTTLLGRSAELYTGDKTRPFNGTYDRDGYVYVMQDAPLPFALVSLTMEGQEYD